MPTGSPDQDGSVYLSSRWFHRTTIVTADALSNVTTLRFAITPLSSDTLNVLDAWFNVFPATGSLAVM